MPAASDLPEDLGLPESPGTLTATALPIPSVTPVPTSSSAYAEVDIPDLEALNFSERTEVFRPSSIYVTEYQGDIYYIDTQIIYRIDADSGETSVYYDGTDFTERLHDYYWTVDTRYLTPGWLRAFYIHEDTFYGFIAMYDVYGIEFYVLYNLETEEQIEAFEGIPYGVYQNAILYDTSYLLISPYRDNPELDNKISAEQAMFDFQEKTSGGTTREKAEAFIRKAARDLKINPDLSQLKFDGVKDSILGKHVLCQQ